MTWLNYNCDMMNCVRSCLYVYTWVRPRIGFATCNVKLVEQITFRYTVMIASSPLLRIHSNLLVHINKVYRLAKYYSGTVIQLLETFQNINILLLYTVSMILQLGRLEQCEEVSCSGSTGAMWVKFLHKEPTTTNSTIWELNLDLLYHRPIPNHCMLLPHKANALYPLTKIETRLNIYNWSVATYMKTSVVL